MKRNSLLTMLIVTVFLITSLAACVQPGPQTSAPVENATKSAVEQKPTEALASEPQPTESTTGTAPAQSPGTEMDAEQVLNLFMDNPLTLDINDARNQSEFQVLAMTQEGLFRVFNNDGVDKLELAGAESYEVSDDGLVWTFHIRPQKWSDGQPVTAQQYVDSIYRLLDPAKAFSYAFFAFDIKGAQDHYSQEKVDPTVQDVGVRAIDDKTLEITLERATPEFGKKLSFAVLDPIRLDLIEKGGETFPLDFKAQAYNGPFIITDWVKDNSMVLEKNPSYWDAENVHINKVNLSVVAEVSTQAQMFESQQSDIIAGSGEYINKWAPEAESGKFVRFQNPAPGISMLTFEQQTGGLSGLMQNAKIRKAISLAVNRQELLDTIYNRYFPAYGLIPYGISIGDEEFRQAVPETLKAEYETVVGKPEEVQKIFLEGLKEAGKPEDLSQVELTFLAYGSDAQSKAYQEYITQSISNTLGIKVTIKPTADVEAFRDARNKNEWDINTMGWFGDYNDPMTMIDMWITDSGFSSFFGHFSSPAYDELFTTLAGETDLAKRKEIFSALENQLISVDAGLAPLYYNDNSYFVHNYVKNVTFPSFGPGIEYSRAYISGK